MNLNNFQVLSRTKLYKYILIIFFNRSHYNLKVLHLLFNLTADLLFQFINFLFLLNDI